MSRITDYILEPKVVYTEGGFLVRVKVIDDYKYKKYIVSENLHYKTVQGTSFTLTDASSTKQASILELKGNTTQEGTPTPSSPVEVKTVSGDNNVVVSNKNLFDKSTIVAGDIKGSNTSIRLSSRQVLWLEPGTYTMSTNAVSPFRYACSVQNVGVPPLSSYPTYILDSGWQTGNTSYTFTLSTAGYFVLALSKTSGNITVEEVANFEYQLEKGNQATDYTEHKRSSYRVDLGGTNLFNFNDTASVTNSTVDSEGWITATIDNSSGTGWAYANYFMNKIPKLKASTTYTIMTEIKAKSGNLRNIVFNASNSQINASVNIVLANYQEGSKVVNTVTTRESFSGIQYGLRLYVDTRANTSGSVTYRVSVIEGTNVSTEFSPYTDNPIELNKIGNYQDKLYYNSGKWYIEKNIRHLSLAIADMNNSNDYPGWKNQTQLKEDYPNKNGALYAYCNFLSNIQEPNVAGASINTTGTGAALWLSKAKFNLTQNEWKANYPNLVVDIYYNLSTPTYTEITDTYLISQLNALKNIQLYDNLCYVDWVGTLAGIMTLQYAGTEDLGIKYIITEDGKKIRTDWRKLGRRKKWMMK